MLSIWHTHDSQNLPETKVAGEVQTGQWNVFVPVRKVSTTQGFWYFWWK